MPYGVLNVFLPDYLQQEKHLAFYYATGLILLYGKAIVYLLGLGSLIGTLLGGYLGQKVYVYRRAFLPIFLSVTLGIAVPMMCYFYTFNYVGRKWYIWVFYVIYILASCIMLNLNGSNIRAILLNVNLPESRGSVISMAQFLNNIGQTLGPIAFSLFLK